MQIHHTAYDRNFLGIDTNYRVHINVELLIEKGGPMLKHGLQEMHGSEINVPQASSRQPDRDSLAERFTAFRAAS